MTTPRTTTPAHPKLIRSIICDAIGVAMLFAMLIVIASFDLGATG